MHYSLIEQNLKTLLACQKIKLVTKQGGGNSVVFCIEADNKTWAVKSYPPYAPNQRDRLAAELQVYTFLNQNQVPFVPLLKNYSESDRLLIISWIDGEIPRDYSKSDIEQAIQFIHAINRLNTSSDALQLPLAAEACLSLTTLISQIERRFERLKPFAEEEKDLGEFLFKSFRPILEQCQQKAIKGYHANGINPDMDLPQENRSLIPADFGFHNTIRDKEGKLFFFDFDYFGWDDPVKLLADILWHPKMPLSKQQKQQFVMGISDVYNADPLFLSRFYYTLPLFGLRWVLILLNEFIPAFWQNRQHADAFKDLAHNQAEAKKIQLNRAKELLLNVKQIGSSYEVTAATSI